MPTKREQPPTAFAVATTREIKARMAALGVTNAAVARIAGLSQNYLNERLREEKSFTLSDIERLAKYFNVSPAALIAAAEERAGEHFTVVYIDDVGAEGDTAGIEELPTLTPGELAQRDLGKAAHRGRRISDQGEEDADNARPRT